MGSHENTSLDTQLIHAGEPGSRPAGAVSMPIFQSSTFEYDGARSYHDLRYIRLNNTPNHDVVHAKLASIEGTGAALVTASGMAAISTALLAFLKAGDHLLVQDRLYGGTHDFVTKDLPSLGIEFDFIDPDSPANWEEKRRPTTRVIYVESVANPRLEIPDLEAVPRFARTHGLIAMIDNTFPSPVNFRPARLGFDLVLHSATKSLNGHSDLVAGCVLGSQEHVERVRHKLNHLGASLEPFGCFLLHRGLKTLGVRMRQQNATALELARWLDAHERIVDVRYPGLESHPQHDRAKRLFDGFGSMIAFEIDGDETAADAFLERLTLAVQAPSLGGVETLVTRPCLTSHRGVPDEERRALGIADRLIRLSVGLEAFDDLRDDFENALRSA